mgnify:FL=1
MKQGLITEINTMEDAIESLKELYIKISNQRNLFINKEQDMQSNTKYKNLTKEMLDNIIGKKDETDNRKIIQFLKNIIEDILENEPNQEIKQKLEGIFGTYYISLRNKIEKLIKPQKGEEIVLDLIRQSEVKIHDDKSPKEDAIYGDLIQENEQTPEIIYKDKNMMLIRLNKYITNKTQKEKDKKIVEKLEKEEVSKYEYQIKYEPNKVAIIEYFGETNLGNKIKKGEIEYIAPMLAAIEKAKSEKREHIGRIYKIFEELGTYVTQYDDNLEQRVKELKLKEEEIIKETEKSEEKNKEEK